LKNIEAILEAAGSSMGNIVSATFILRNPEDFAEMNDEWSAWFPENPPARQGASLPVDVEGLLVSIAVIANE
jgi:2-iminobutanoate/2-iminopropanoate deaminase